MSDIPNIPTPGNSGGSKPEPSKRVEGDDFNKESDLTEGQDSTQAGKPSAAQRAAGTAAKVASNVSEAASDLKDIAEASKDPTGISSGIEEIKEGAEKDGVKGALGAGTRVAAGNVVKIGITAASAGTGAAAGSTAGEATTKGLKWVNKIGKPLIASAVVVSAVAIGVGIQTVGNILTNPWGTSVKVAETLVRGVYNATVSFVSDTWDWLTSDNNIYGKYGYVEYRPGSALAAPSITATPKPGSLEDKFLKVDFKKASWQSDARPGCPYYITYKELVNPRTGSKINVIDKVKDDKGKDVDKKDEVAKYCMANSMPLYNMMIRNQTARDVNKFSGTEQSYADGKDSSNFKDKSKKEMYSYVYGKTIDRVTSKASDNPKVGEIKNIDGKDKKKFEAIQNYIDTVRSNLESNKEPNAVEISPRTVGIDPKDNSRENQFKTLCTFSKAYLTGDNLRKGIYGRVNSAQRSIAKTSVLSSTAGLNLVSGNETTMTYPQMEDWYKSVAYTQNVYGTNDGVAPDPERYANAAYAAKYSDTISLLLNIQKACEDYSDESVLNDIWNFFTGNKDEAEKNISQDYNALQKIVYDQSNGKFDSPDKVGINELLTGVITLGSGTAISGVESGAQNYNNQYQGQLAQYNQYSIRMGARFLTPAEAKKLAAKVDATQRYIEKRSGIAYRLFDTKNIRSLASIVGAETPKTPREASTKTKDYLASLSNPVKLIADIQSRVNYVAFGESNVAYAAENKGNSYFKMDTVGIPAEDFKSVDIFKNSDEIQDMLENGTDAQKKVLGYFDKCSKSNIPTKNVFARQYEVLNGDSDDEASVVGSKAITEDFGNVKIPVYPSAGDVTKLGFADKREFIACEIYLLPGNAATKKDLYPLQQNLFGFDIRDLAKKYQIYLYSNSTVDLMVQLSSTEKTDSIYANPSTGGGGGNNASVPGDAEENAPCPEGTKFQQVGIDKDKSGKEVKKFNVCTINGSTINVNVKIAAKVAALVNKARSDGINFSGFGYRSFDRQVQLRRAHCGSSNYDIYEKPSKQCSPPTAIPGNSMHEEGLAIDFETNGDTLSKGGKGYNWLVANAANYGLINLPSEPWHWSVNGR